MSGNCQGILIIPKCMIPAVACLLSTFSNISSETTGPIEVKFHVEHPWDGGTKVCLQGPVVSEELSA